MHTTNLVRISTLVMTLMLMLVASIAEPAAGRGMPECEDAGVVTSHQKISDLVGRFDGALDDEDQFGRSVTAVGDLDRDGIADLAVGAQRDDDGGDRRGAVWILFMNADGTVRSEQKISDTEGGFGGTLNDLDVFGAAVEGLGDLNGDDIPDLAVGTLGDDGGLDRGAIWILFLDRDGTVQTEQKIAEGIGGFVGPLADEDNFGASGLALLGDVDADGVQDLAASAFADDDGGNRRGAVWILFLNTDGTVKAEQKISDLAGGFGGVLDDGDAFGGGGTSPGDLDMDGVPDLVVGANGDDDGAAGAGAIWVLFLNTDGTVQAEQKISNLEGGFGGTLDTDVLFGSNVGNIGDVDGDGVVDMAVSAPRDDDGGYRRGAVWVLFMNADGTVHAEQKISDLAGEFEGELDDEDRFGFYVAGVGNLSCQGAVNVAVGATFDDDGGFDRGAVYILNLLQCLRPLRIVEQPSCVLLEPGGGTAVFTVDAVGDGDLSYQWLRNGVILTDGPDIIGSTTAELTVMADNDDIAWYAVMVTNDVDTITSDAAVLGIEQSCTGDINYDGVVNVPDLLALLGAWGECP